MAFRASMDTQRTGRGTGRTGMPRSRVTSGLALADSADQTPPRDLKKIVLIAGLGILSWVATYVGMLELIEANMGDLPLVHKLIVAFSVAMLMIMIIWLLDQMFAPVAFTTKFVYAIGYVFLTLISVGFGFGFYWKVLESRSEASRSAESAVSQVQGSLNAAATRLDQLQSTLVTLSNLSAEKAELERTKGTSCPNSRPGDGPRRKMREEDAQRFSFASDFVKDRATAVRGTLSALDGDLQKIVNSDPSTFDARTGTRNEFMKSLSRKLDMTVTSFNAFRTDPQLRQLRTELADRGEQSTFGDPKKGGFICPDAQLQGALRGAVKAIDQLPQLEKPAIAAVEGSEATIEAFRRLTATFYGALSFKMPPSADELRELQQRAVQSVEGGLPRGIDDEAVGLSKRDYVPLAVAIFVDLCLLLVSIGRPVNRLGGLMPRMVAAENSPVSTILSRFNDIHRDPEIRQTFEVFRHVVFDQAGVYYVAVPLDAPYTLGRRWAPSGATPAVPGYGTAEAQELQHEAHLLANLFTSFEKERIFARVYSPLLTTSAIQRKLARQGSKFAGCRSFRVYRFRDGAWQEIILGAVMGAARRAEQERANAVDEPELPMVPASRPVDRRPARETPPSTRHADGGADRYASTHGPYARAARDELSAKPERDQDFGGRAANSNTAPASRVAEPPEVPLRPCEEASPTVVALPVRTRPAAGPVAQGAGGVWVDGALAPAIDLAAPQSAAGEKVVDVVMRRETATFQVPVSAATLPGELFSCGTVSGAIRAVRVEPVEAQVPVMLAANPEQEIEASTDDQQDLAGRNMIDQSAEDEAVEIARLAGRLRPALS